MVGRIQIPNEYNYFRAMFSMNIELRELKDKYYKLLRVSKLLKKDISENYNEEKINRLNLINLEMENIDTIMYNIRYDLYIKHKERYENIVKNNGTYDPYET